ncbi:hypothetical protein QVD17_38751 [Tagetes erecta]|uniref:Uncharacterized protein n=1 Tax=Tagetes erecta TaxID=13708 RepID=A0AAD8JSP5_TARER|nr:hypothetical protein QVD17_38751 [Tagetes erecta]
MANVSLDLCRFCSLRCDSDGIYDLLELAGDDGVKVFLGVVDMRKLETNVEPFKHDPWLTNSPAPELLKMRSLLDFTHLRFFRRCKHFTSRRLSRVVSRLIILLNSHLSIHFL